MGIKFDVNKLNSGLTKLDKRAGAALSLYAEACSKKFEAHAKSNYPWTDRTYMASKTLTGDYQWIGDSIVRITLEHGADYGVYLEVCNEGRYAIVWPTIQSQSASALQGLRNLLR